MMKLDLARAMGMDDGPTRTKGWLWVLVTPLVKVFSVVLSRLRATAKTLIGEAFKGILISDRYSAYNWLDVMQRQVCWAHLKRDLTAMAERTGVSKQIGEALLHREHRSCAVVASCPRWHHESVTVCSDGGAIESRIQGLRKMPQQLYPLAKMKNRHWQKQYAQPRSY